MINFDFFTSQSIEGCPLFLLTNYNKKLVQSLKSLLNSTAKGLQTDFSELVRFTNEINTKSKLKPELYALHSSLLNSLKINNVDNVLKHILKLEKLIKVPHALPFSIQTCAYSDWEDEILQDLRKKNMGACGELPILNSIEESIIKKFEPNVINSIDIIKKASPSFYSEFFQYVSGIKLFYSNKLVGMTDPRVYGTIYIALPMVDLPPEVYFCEHIIHETSHLHLNTLFAIDPLILNNEEERYSAPIRPDPRPMYGIFHATFVLSRMVRVFSTIALSNKENAYRDCLETFKKQFKAGYNTIASHGKLTDLGKKIVNSYADLV